MLRKHCATTLIACLSIALMAHPALCQIHAQVQSVCSWNKMFLLGASHGVQYAIDFSQASPILRFVETNLNGRVAAAATDSETGELVYLIIEKAKTYLTRRTKTDAKQIAVPEGIANTNYQWLLAKNGNVYLVNTFLCAKWNGKDWQVIPLQRNWRSPEWCREHGHLIRTFIINDRLVLVFQAGEWGSGVITFDLNTRQWEKVYPDYGTESSEEHDVESVTADTKGNLWIVTRSNLVSWNQLDKTYRKYKVPENGPCNIAIDSNNQLFLSTYDGVIYKLSEGMFQQFFQLPTQEVINIKTAGKESAKVIWLGYSGNQLICQYSDSSVVLLDATSKALQRVPLSEDILRL